MSDGDRRILILVRIFAAFVVLLHVWGALSPGSDNWGVHFFAFLPAGFRIIGILLMLVALFPSVQRLSVDAYGRLVKWWEGRSSGTRRSIVLILIGAGAGCFWMAKEGTTFLGDGFGFIKSLPNVTSAGDLPSVFRHEPLAGYLLWKTYGAIGALSDSAGALTAFRIVSIGCGIAFLVVLAYLARMLADSPEDRLSLYAFILSAGGTQLFFGYAETYPPSYVVYVIFLLSGILYLRDRISLLIPSVLFAVLFVFYFGMLAFAPVLGLLYIESTRKKEHGITIVSLLAMVLTAGTLLALCGYTPGRLLERFGGADSHILPLLQTQSVWQGYTMFSSRHLIELVNVHLLLSPFALFIGAAVCVIYRRSLIWKSVEWRFIFLNACCGLLMTGIVQCDIGMSRDWDLLAVFAVGGVIAAGYLVTRELRDAAVKRTLILAATFISMIHVAAFVAVNADDGRAISRFTVLAKNSLWGTKAFTVYEELAIYYREKDDLPASAAYYRKFLEHDSTNSRVFGNLADVSRSLGDEEGERTATERAVALGTQVPSTYFNLGVIYGKNGRYDEAIRVMSRGLLLDPRRPDILNSVGAFYMQGKNAYEEALPWFRKAMELDSAYALAYLNAGICEYRLGKNDETEYYLTRFLLMEPQYPQNAQIREIIEQVSRRK